LPAGCRLFSLYAFIAQSNRATLHDRLRDQPARRAHPTPGKAVCRIYERDWAGGAAVSHIALLTGVVPS